MQKGFVMLHVKLKIFHFFEDYLQFYRNFTDLTQLQTKKDCLSAVLILKKS